VKIQEREKCKIAKAESKMKKLRGMCILLFVKIKPQMMKVSSSPSFLKEKNLNWHVVDRD